MHFFPLLVALGNTRAHVNLGSCIAHTQNVASNKPSMLILYMRLAIIAQKIFIWLFLSTK